LGMDRPSRTCSAPGFRSPASMNSDSASRARRQIAAPGGAGRVQPKASARAPPRGRAAAGAPPQRAGNSAPARECGGRGGRGGQSVPPAPRLLSAAEGSGRPGRSTPPDQKREFVQKGGFSVRAPDERMRQDLVRRQQIADRARPKPKASDIRFTEMVDPKAARASEADKAAARERWVAEMQAKADPRQIRRAAKEAEAARREEERIIERANREEFEQQWYEREAVRKQAQQQRTSEVNVEAREHWSQCTLPESQVDHSEPVIPVPEDVDFGSVRRRLAAQQRRSQSLGTPSTRSGKLALAAQAAAARQQQQQQQTPVRQFSENHEIIQAQDQEFQLCLLHDQIKDLLGQRGELLASATPQQEALEDLQQRKTAAQQRLERYGENPRLRSELQDMEKTERQTQESLAEVTDRLAEVEAELNDRQELLATVSAVA